MMTEETVDGLIDRLRGVADGAPEPLGDEIKSICGELSRAMQPQRAKSNDDIQHPPYSIVVTTVPAASSENSLATIMNHFGQVTGCRLRGVDPNAVAQVTFAERAAAERIVNAFREVRPRAMYLSMV